MANQGQGVDADEADELANQFKPMWEAEGDEAAPAAPATAAAPAPAVVVAPAPAPAVVAEPAPAPAPAPAPVEAGARTQKIVGIPVKAAGGSKPPPAPEAAAPAAAAPTAPAVDPKQTMIAGSPPAVEGPRAPSGASKTLVLGSVDEEAAGAMPQAAAVIAPEPAPVAVAAPAPAPQPPAPAVVVAPAVVAEQPRSQRSAAIAPPRYEDDAPVTPVKRGGVVFVVLGVAALILVLVGVKLVMGGGSTEEAKPAERTSSVPAATQTQAASPTPPKTAESPAAPPRETASPAPAPEPPAPKPVAEAKPAAGPKPPAPKPVVKPVGVGPKPTTPKPGGGSIVRETPF